MLSIFLSRYRFWKSVNNNNQSFRSKETAWFMSKYRVLHRSGIKDFPCMLNSFNFHFSLLTIGCYIDLVLKIFLVC